MNNAQEPKGSLFAVYGTLRQGFGNHQRYLANNECKYLGTEVKLLPYKMVSLGGFPGLIPTDRRNSITYEVFSINDKEVENALDMLEGYPDFYEKAKIQTAWGEASIYYLHSPRYANYPVIEDGDWVNRVKQV